MAGFDDIKDKSLLSSKGSELLKARQERISNKSVQEVRILEKMAQDLQEIDKLTSNLDVEFDKKLAEVTRLSHRVEEMKKAVAQVEKGRIHGAEKTFKQSAITMTGSSATLSDISAASKSTASLGSALSMAQSQSTQGLEEYIASRKSLLVKQNERIRETSSSIEGNEGTYGNQVSVRNNLVSQVGQAQAALTAQKRLGIDTQSTYYGAADATARVRADQDMNTIRSGVGSGAFGGRKQVEEQLDSVAKRLISTFELLDAAVKSGAKETGDLSKEFNSLEKEYKKNKNILGEMGRVGGGGDGRSGAQVAGGIIGNLGTIAQGVGQGMRHIGVTSELSQAQNRIGFANMANQRFTDAYGATQGDMSSLRRAMGDQYSESIRRGFLLGEREDSAKAVDTVGAGARAIGTGINAATGSNSVGSAVKGFFTGGPKGAAVGVVTNALAQATPDALNAVVGATDYGKGISQGQAFLQAQQQDRALKDAISKISDFSSQAASDQHSGLTLATRGLGVGSTGANYNDATSFAGTGEMGARGLLPGTLGDGPELTATASKRTGGIKDYIKSKEGLSLKGYADTSRGYSIGYGSFVAGKSQKGKTITKEEADELFEKNFGSHSGAVDKMLGPDVMGKLNEGQRDALYDLSYNAGPGALNYGRKGQSIASRLKRGDIDGAGQQLRKTALTADGSIHPGLVGRREDGYAMWTGSATSGAMPSDSKIGSLSGSGIKGGGDRENVFDTFNDPNTINRIANTSGLSGKDVNRLVGQGVKGLGKEFARDSGAGGEADITRAGQLSRIGYMESPDQYMQARSTMTGSGGGKDDFEEILKNAVANGMDASKNIMEMVQATTSLANKSAQAGIAAFGGASESLGMGIDALRKTGVSENMATAAAANAANASEGMAQDKGLNLANVIETARLRKSFGKADLSQLEAMRTTKPQEARELRNLYRTGKSKEAKELAIKMGIWGKDGVNDEKGASALLEATTEQVTRRATGFGLNRKMEESIQEARRSGRDLTDEERTFMNSRTKNNVDPSVSGDAMLGVNTTAGGANKGALKTDSAGSYGSGEDKIKSAATADAKVFAEGVENFNKAIGGMDALGQTLLKVSEALKPEEFAKSVKDAATDFKIPTKAFGDSVKEFNTAVEKLLNAVGGKSPNLKDQVNINQTRGK